MTNQILGTQYYYYQMLFVNGPIYQHMMHCGPKDTRPKSKSVNTLKAVT